MFRRVLFRSVNIIMKASFVLTLIFSTISFISTAIAQSNSSAKSVLDNASKVYSSYKTIMADFTLQGDNKQENSSFSEKGKVYLVPGSGKFKIETDNHAIISDGKIGRASCRERVCQYV